MPDKQKKLTLRNHVWFIYALSIILLVFIWYFQWVLGMIMTVLLAMSLYYSIRSEQALQDQAEKYITTLSYRVKKVGEEALLEMPFGIILYNDDFKIEWANPYMHRFDDGSLVGDSLHKLSEDLIPMIKENKEKIWFELQGFVFETVVKKEERLLYLFDRTEQSELQAQYRNEQTILGFIFLDNYEEITQNMDDTNKSKLNSQVTSVLNQWSKHHGLYLKRTSQERFLAVGTKQILANLEKAKFEILDEVRGLSGERNTPVTLSIGIGAGDVDLPTLGELAQSSLDLALGRGGDQVAIKDESGKVRFYGGKTNPMEKRTRVRARVISHALKELIRASDNVIIMGHKSPDMDSIGAAIGILNIALANDVEGYIVFDPNDIDTGVYRLVDKIKEDEEIWQYFVEPDEAQSIVNNRSLVVVVDTHRPSMVASEALLQKTDYKVVIDHHRRGEDFIDNPTLVYMEPYASSTAELVTELLEYQPKKLKLRMLEATALLAGIIVDTKSFTLRTGSRTFDAASYLRAKGADTVLVQELLKEDIDVYVERSKLIERAELYRNQIAIAKAKEGQVHGPVLIAQTADILLTMSGIAASFVISERKDGRIGISARSLGDINVQVIMEKMNGGGHLTNAATQMEDTTIDEAEQLLKEILDEYYEGSETE
ncbi:MULTISPECIES: DHH family phosphoesterase [Clostridia]|uniref:DHH family phosphoesterase n=1 Tax=Clostridia TaxID=186801 RepID=UPI000EA06C6F|nr:MULTISPECIES: DHH family phosphoesterase [Clostridia]NBJ69809.1 DHH family phosphoesterase [Roseburia sp. 1XD42-34]RKI77882.1 DHH family phosphoesterase [Clostridium sp. 1xD42-85]